MCFITDQCFMCINHNGHIPLDDKIVTQIEYIMPEITIIKLGIPLRICTICEEALQSFDKFKRASVENSLRLEARIKESKCNRNSDAQQRSDAVACVAPDSLHTKTNIIQAKNEDMSDMNIEQIFIKEEPLEETPCDYYDDNTISADHDTLQTKNADTKDFYCSVCNKSFRIKSRLARHMKAHTEKKDFQCYICNKFFTQKDNLKTHIKIHSGIKDYKCSICNKSFTRKDSQIMHMKIHTGTKDFKCSICNKLFTQSNNLREHMKIHTGIKNYHCLVCNKDFTQKSSLITHVRTHSAVKEFECPICNKRFTRKLTLSNHMKAHDGIKNFKCSTCNKCFTHKSGLMNHQKKNHSAV